MNLVHCEVTELTISRPKSLCLPEHRSGVLASTVHPNKCLLHTHAKPGFKNELFRRVLP